MTMKTPEQIADATLPYDGSRGTARVPLDWNEVRQIIVEAIEADRAQRDTHTWHAAEDWDISLDEESTNEAWWMLLDLFDADDESLTDRTTQATLLLSDVEAERLIMALVSAVADGREKYGYREDEE